MAGELNSSGSILREATRYRPDIDGIRAVAVISVIAYHIGLPPFSGGFVGVDIFFVISGFLIINQVIARISEGRFSFGDFWARRILRILPPYFLVLVVSGLIANFVLASEEEFRRFWDQVLYSALMIVNHLFLMEQGYFDADSVTKPLLHLWSLAVEEQFYFVAPILLVCLAWIWRRFESGRYVVAGIVVLITVASFLACVWLTDAANEKNYAFYLMPTRMWEFIIGASAAAAAPFLSRLNRRAVELLAISGLALVVFAVTRFTEATPFPGKAAFIPVAGAFLLILAGMSHRRPLVNRMLASPPIVGIGLISYSWYLWHWPLLTFGRIYSFEYQHIGTDLMLGAVLSFVLATCTYLLIERPIREWRRRGVRSGLNWRVAVAGVGACSLVAISAPLQAAVAPVVEIPVPVEPGKAHLECRLPLLIDTKECLESAAGRMTGVILGDSHANAAYRTLNAVAESHGRFLMNSAFNGCTPMLGVVNVRRGNSARCASWQENAASGIETIRPQFAIFAAQWAFHTRWNAAMWSTKPERDQRAFFVKSVRDTIARLQASGVERILVVGPIPVWRRPAPECLARGQKYGVDPSDPCGWSFDATMSRRAIPIEWLSEAVAGLDSVRFADPIKAFCSARWCKPYEGSTLLYRDHSHLTSEGVKRLIAEIEPELQWVMDISGELEVAIPGSLGEGAEATGSAP